MDNKLLNEFVKVDAEYKALEKKWEELRFAIVGRMKTENLTKFSHDLGTFTVAQKAVWSYSPAVDKLSERLKITKYKEELKGLAKKKITEYLKFTLNNELV